jgi:hypothetical protein
MVFRLADYPTIRRAVDGQVIRDVIGYGFIEGFLADPLAGRRVIGEAVTPQLLLGSGPGSAGRQLPGADGRRRRRFRLRH